MSLSLLRVLRCPVEADLPLLEADACRSLERRAAAALPAHALMRRAGLAVARLAAALSPSARSVWIAAGPGNNGGDGLVAAAHLHRHGVPVRVTLYGNPDRLPVDAADALALAREAGVRFADAPPPQVDLAIDALLGLGLARPPEGAIAEAIRRLRSAADRVLAVDVPSGLTSDTGVALGDAVRADATLALLALKPGLFTAEGRDRCGDLWFDDLGVAEDLAAPASLRLTGAGLVRRMPPPRRHAQHKGSFGDVVVIGGSAAMAGAARLAARAALGAGAGRVFIAAAPGSTSVADPARPELMLAGDPRHLDAGWLCARTVVCGCGGGDAVGEVLPTVLRDAGRLVLDADALNAIAATPALLEPLRGRAARGLGTVLTPHPLEAARMLGLGSAADVQRDRLDAARALAERTGAVVVLKGSGTIIANGRDDLRVNPTGDARLAAPGTGDVLAGWIGGVLAQQPSASPADAADAAAASAWLHGAAACAAGPSRSVQAADLIEAMRTFAR